MTDELFKITGRAGVLSVCQRAWLAVQRRTGGVLLAGIALLILVPAPQGCKKVKLKVTGAWDITAAGDMKDANGSSCSFLNHVHIQYLHLVPKIQTKRDDSQILVAEVQVTDLDGNLLASRSYRFSGHDLRRYDSIHESRSYELGMPEFTCNRGAVWRYTVTVKETDGKHGILGVRYGSVFKHPAK